MRAQIGSPDMVNTGPPTPADMEAQRTAALAQIREVYGRVPIGFDELVVSINKAGWPATATVHSLDFFFLTRGVGAVHKDNEGPYFYLSSTKVRPAKGTNETLDLSEWAPTDIVIARFA